MILGALIDAGVPFEAVQQALGSLAVDGYEIAADRVVKGGITAVKFRVRELPTPGHDAAAAPRRARSQALPPEAHPRGHRSLGLERGGEDARQSPVFAAGRGRSGHPRHVDREGAPARGGSARFDHRHRGRGLRARVARGGARRRVAHECRRRHGALGARGVPSAGASHVEAAERGTGLFERSSRPNCSRPPARWCSPSTRRRSDRCRPCGSTASATVPATATCRTRRTCCACSWARATIRRRCR